MGAEQNRSRKCFYLLLASLTVFLLACATTDPVAKPEPPAVAYQGYDCGHLKCLDGFVNRGDFDGAIRECQSVLARYPKTFPGDEAIMNMGLLSAHYANPKKDYKKAMGYFMRIPHDFPQSPLAEEARIWAGVLEAFEKTKQVDLEIEQIKKGRGK